MEDRLLKELIDERATYPEMVRYFRVKYPPGRSYWGILQRAIYLGVNNGVKCRPDLGVRTQTLSLLQLGYSTRKIAQVRGVRQSSVMTLIKKLYEEGLVRKVGKTNRTIRYIPTVDWGPFNEGEELKQTFGLPKEVSNSPARV
jgi:DNA-binding transcriptional ArsR family regulator